MMEHNKFDFRVASALVQAVNSAANTLDVKNGQMEKAFGNLREGFNDDGYDEIAVDMTAANKVIGDVIKQMNIVGKYISDYAEKLKNV